MTKPTILTFETYDEWDTESMEAAYEVYNLPYGGKVSDLPPDALVRTEAFAFRGHATLGADIIDSFPSLGLIANYGVGYDTIDVAHATTKGIKVTNTPEVLTDDVADLAIGIVIALSRDIVGASQWVHSGNWAQNGAFPLQRKVSGKSVGIVGLGRIGRAVAERLQPFRCAIHYFSRSPKEAPGWTYHDDIVVLAKEVDILIVTLSGGPETLGMVGKNALDALGDDGVLINVSRGTTVDEPALLKALENRSIRAAGLDVFESEPNINSRFLELDNVLLQPHQSSGTIETRKAMGQLQRDNLAAYFAGRPLPTPVN